MTERLFGTLLTVTVLAGGQTSPPTGSAGLITTVAGTDFVYPNQSLSGLQAPLGRISGLAFDTAGNLYISDTSNSLVVKMDQNGIVTVFAGNGIVGFSGEGATATSAALNLVMESENIIFGIGDSRIPNVPIFSDYAQFSGGLATDSTGNLFIADTGNHRVRKVSPSGVITTIAGNGQRGFSGDGAAATAASLNNPASLAVDSAGNVFIGDIGNYRIRMVAPSGIITTVVGTGFNDFPQSGSATRSPINTALTALAFDKGGNLYIGPLATPFNALGKVSKAGVLSLIPIFGLYSHGIGSLVFDASGNLFISDYNNSDVLQMTPNGLTNGQVSPSIVAGLGEPSYSGDGGPATAANLNRPLGLALDSVGDLFIADSVNLRLRELTPAGTIRTVAGSAGYRYGGDGAAAVNANLSSPQGVADTATGLVIADTNNNRIRQVAPNGIISTLAGTGASGFSGDGGPATAAMLQLPHKVARGTAGDVLIADTLNNVVRRVNSAGIISTVIGGGVSVAVDASGDIFTSDSVNTFEMAPNGLETSLVAAYGFLAYDIASDAAGNLLLADDYSAVNRFTTGNLRRPLLGRSGEQVLAGNGIVGFSGDGGRATAAELNFPSGVAMDAEGNVYIADSLNHRVRKVAPDGVISTVAGTGTAAFSGDGGSATAAALNNPMGVGVDAGGNLYIADTGNNRIREVLFNPPFFRGPLASGSLSLSLTQASGGRPVSATLTASTTITETSSIAVPGMAYSAEVTSGGAWLSLSPQSGSTPGLITVTADPLNLSPDVYNGVIVINVPLANPPKQTVNVQFTVTAGVAASVSLDQTHMSFTYATTSAARNQTLIVSNSGGGSMNFATSITLNSSVSANWLSVTPQSGTATPGNPIALAVHADPSQLPPGTYTGSLTIQGGGAGSVTIPVTMTITTNPLVMLLSQVGLTFTAVQDGGAIPPQTFGVLNLGSGTLNWVVQTSTLTGGNWLIANPDNGSSDAAAPSGAPLVTVSVNPAGLSPGVYYGLVKVVSAGAANTPQEVVAVLQVLPAGTDVAPIVQPSSLIFSSSAGASSPSSQNVLVYDPTGTSKSFQSEIVTMNGSGWLVTLPSDATIAPTEPTQIVVQPMVNGLNPGTYLGTLTLQFSDGRVNTVAITFVVTGTGTSSASSSVTSHTLPLDSGSSTCTPTKLIPVLTTLGPGFSVPASYPEGLTAQVVDDCGTPLTQGKVSVEFSTGQGLKYMQSLNNGRWDVTWQTGSQQVSQVTLTVHAVHPTLPITGDAQVNGALGARQAKPQVSDGGVVSAATFTVTPLAPGGIISIFGSQLSDGTSAAPVLPLSTQLNNTTVRIGDALLPLFYTSTGQLNAVVPYEAAVNTNLQLLVQRDNTYATPVYVDVAATQPGVLQNGNMEAIAVDSSGNLIGPSNPTHAGNVLTMYCLGLGAVSPAVADGAAAPSSPPASVVNPLKLTVGTQTANVLFAGLTPGLAGLYQLNFYVPQGTPTGDQVPVTVATGGQTSAAVNLSVR